MEEFKTCYEDRGDTHRNCHCSFGFLKRGVGCTWEGWMLGSQLGSPTRNTDASALLAPEGIQIPAKWLILVIPWDLGFSCKQSKMEHRMCECQVCST